MKYLLLPFSYLYKLVTDFRNLLFKKNILKSFQFETKVIGVGNLSVGGTGKTPHVEYLVKLLGEKFSIGILSRGYGRKTKGFILADDSCSADTIGDEPYQYYLKFKPEVSVAVGEERITAIPAMLKENTDIDLVVLDDAFQHRYVKPHVNILLSEYGRPFFKDFIMPAGRLRESKKGAKRADVIVITKCPTSLSEKDKNYYIKKIKKYSKPNVPVFFTSYKYGTPIAFSGQQQVPSKNILLLTGIAGTDYLCTFLKHKYHIVKHLKYSDHHRYNKYDIAKIVKEYHRYSEASELVVFTTEKDMVRLIHLKDLLDNIPVFYLPIEVQFTDEGARQEFAERIFEFTYK
ncbi:tetraacyldisaccharide 4'-kinase [Cytophagaceae bacterium ABcell3]|nr:tetraacyldisaccharide 4'-kinase [Cytophagaceae bacterium ABcell3]